MKKLGVVLLLLVSMVSLGALLPTQPPVCTATPPAQAIAAGYTKLVYCNTLTSTFGLVDVNNTQNPWFQFYTTAFGFTLPSSAITPGSGGLALTNPNTNSSGPYSIYLTPTSYGGTTITGGYYIEIDTQFDASICEQAPNSWPGATWTTYPNGLTNHNYDSARFVEFDIFEWINCSGVMAVHDWTNSNPQVLTCTNSDATVSVSPGNGFNTYGGLFIPANGGTGTFSHYFNNTLKNTLTYSAGGVPSPAGTCPSGAFSSADTQPWAFALQGGTTAVTTVRNLHIWQAP